MIPVALIVVLLAGGCGPLVRVKATIRSEEMTRLERQVLGERAELGPQMVLLPLEGRGAAPDDETLRRLDEQYKRLEARLAKMAPKTAALRAWEVVSLHNRAVLRARLGERDAALRLLESASKRAAAYWLTGLQWQVALTRSELDNEHEPDILGHAAELLVQLPSLSALDHSLEEPGRIDELFGRLIASNLDAAPERALELAFQWEAVRLSRAVPPGGLDFPSPELARAQEELRSVRRHIVRERAERCRLPLDELEEIDGLLTSEAGGRLRAAADSARSASALGGLLAADPADALELQEGFAQDAALLILAPAGEGAYAGFLLGPEQFACRRLPRQSEARSGRAIAEALIRPFAADIGDKVKRLYLCPPPELHAVRWGDVPFGDARLAERFNLVFVGGASDLQWALRQRHYGKESVLICAGGPGRGEKLSSQFAQDDAADVFDLRKGDKLELAKAAAFRDFLWLANPVSLLPASPAESYIGFPGGLGRVDGMSLEETSAWKMRASAIALASMPANAFEQGSFMSLRALTRALIAARVPSMVYGVESAGESAFWESFLRGLKKGPVAQAFSGALAQLPPEDRGKVRLYGSGGMTERQYAEFSKLDFQDTLRAARLAGAQGHYEEAAARYLDLWHMALALHVDNAGLANIQLFLRDCWRGLRAYGQAARHQRLRIRRLEASGVESAGQMASERQSLGALLTQAGKFDEAADAYQQALALAQKEGGAADAAHLMGELGKSLDRAGKYEEALAEFQRALDAYLALDQYAQAARQRRRMGAVCLRRLSDAPAAREHFQRATELFAKAGDTEGAAGATLDLGLCERRLGDFERAMELFSAAGAVAEKHDLVAVRARALTELGNTHWMRGEYQQALELVTKSNEIARKAEDDFQLNVNYQLLGLIYWQLNNYERALQALGTALKAARRAEMPLEVASVFNNRGIVYRRQGDYEKALASFHEALETDRRLGSRWGQGYDQRNVGMTLGRMGQYAEASSHLEQAIELSGGIDDKVNLAKSLLALAEVELDQGRGDEAEKLFQGALRQSRDIYLPEVEWRALRGLGRLSRLAGDDQGAWERFREGIEVVERLRGGLKIEELRSGFLSNKMDLYEDAVATLLELDRPEDAFHYAEKSRARKFMDVLGGRRLELKTEEEQRLYDRQQQLARRIGAMRQALPREKDEKKRAELARQLDGLQQDYSDVLLDISVRHPSLSGFVGVEAVSAEDVKKFLPHGVCLLVYYMLNDELVIWTWRDGVMETRRVPAEREDLTRKIRQYRLMVQNREQLDETLRASRELHKALIEPVAGFLEGADVVGIVPHRGLHYLSFASLYDGESFLVEQMPIFYSPSASVLARTLQGAPPRRPAQRRQLAVLALGNPDVANAAYRLPFTEREVESIKRDYDKVTTLTGAAATEDRLREEIGQFDIVHIGAHAWLDSANPLFSSLVLTPGKQDGLLHLYEVPGLDIHAQLLALSACQSGVGRLESGDEVVSLSRAFAYAGARTILSTLWRVDDVSTALVSKHFYRHYAEHGAAESLRYAQLKVMNDGRHRHPTYWAGVVLTGEFR
ncbi:MAG: CHAT domain-containing protein [Planctomycetes bacterium]|nr:CHAT domain-containing protein [Planctomycetota bacterium]